MIHFVPSMLQLFLDDPRARDCVSLRRVFCGGEVLTRALHDLYGPAEAANDVSFWD